MGLLSHPTLAHTKRALRSLYSALPFELAVRAARGKPHWAFYIRQRDRHITINDYLDSFSVAIDTSSDIQRRMLSRTYEPEVLDVIKRFLPNGGVCLDVGANVGSHTLPMAEQAGRAGLVHAFEPGPAFVARLRHNVRLNPAIADRITVHELGLSDREGTSQWQDSTNDPGTATMHWVDPTRPADLVAVTTLDKFVAANSLDRIDLLKVDVDGMDHLVIRGGAEAIKRFQPVVIFETTICDAEQMRAAEETTRWFEQSGYKIYRVDPQMIKPTQFPNLSMNTLALPKSMSIDGARS